MSVTRDALAVETPRWIVGDFERHAGVARPHAGADGRADCSVQSTDTDDPVDIDYRVEEQIKEHSDTVRLWQKQLDETYSYRSQVETAIGVCKDRDLRI